MRRSILLAGVLASSLALGACSSSSDDTAKETPKPSDSASAAAGGSLTMWVDETRLPAVTAAAKEYESATGNKIELVQKNFDDIRADFLAQVPTGEGPDITVGAHDWLGELTSNGVVEPIELGDLASGFEPVALQAFTFDGSVYALPYAIENIAIIRNTALAPEATPATFDEMIAAGQATGATYPFLIQVDEKGDGYTMYPFQTSFGAPVFKQNDDGSYTSELALGGEAGNNFATWLATQGTAGIFKTTMTYDIATAAFAAGESPYILGGPWMVDMFKEAGIDVAIDPIPSAGGEEARPFTGVQGFYISAQSKNKILAADFLTNYMSTQEAQVALFKAGNRTPALIAAADEVSADPIAAGFRAVGKNAVPMPSIPEMGSVWSFWGVTEAGIISGTLDPVTGWEKMVSDIQAAIG
ncbi:carbohydrate ABC transporter substrate-binding protein, CUT1 family [Sanguibacter gelidistatuariae]|uniref:Carbohydrate ABC transporter substrate-binding protein, CUT1 family n=1 Tax=Sanguibacter gelidistatuariae TaxID=1814289 RepID=A0A1G6S1J3_9MICO|nr:maltose ABC transporter substrate-binding protein [Sanguibacter gelidistatuariae]SDD10543.1 carbohydrate ABC transporter substrate-binding protein, CUT1 family [Sanguibacter gelidistatuariae]